MRVVGKPPKYVFIVTRCIYGGFFHRAVDSVYPAVPKFELEQTVILVNVVTRERDIIEIIYCCRASGYTSSLSGSEATTISQCDRYIMLTYVNREVECAKHKAPSVQDMSQTTTTTTTTIVYEKSTQKILFGSVLAMVLYALSSLSFSVEPILEDDDDDEEEEEEDE
jgi:hypothetical protein